MEIEITYSVQYQQDNDPTWVGFIGRMYNEIDDMKHAQTVATQLLDGEIHTDSRPEYQDNVTATRISQLIYAGGTLITFGNPQESDDTKEA